MIIRQFLINKDIETLVSYTSRFRRLWIIISQATKTRIAEKHRGNLDLETPLPVGSQMNRRDIRANSFKHEASTRARIILMRVNAVIVEAFIVEALIATLRNEIHRTWSSFNLLLSIRLSRRKSLENTHNCVIQRTFRSFSFLPIQQRLLWTIRSLMGVTLIFLTIFKQFHTLIYSFVTSKNKKKKVKKSMEHVRSIVWARFVQHATLRCIKLDEFLRD